MIGEIKVTAGVRVPQKYLLCDGQLVSKTAYPILFDEIGYLYGGMGDLFAVPDLVDKGIFGTDDTGLLGQEFGSDSVTLSVANLPQHKHNIEISTSTNGGLVATEGSHLTSTAFGNPTAAAIYTTVPSETKVNLSGVTYTGNNIPVAITPKHLKMLIVIKAA